MIFLGLVCTEIPAIGDRLALSRGPPLNRSPWGYLVHFSVLHLQVGTQLAPNPSLICSASVPARTSSPTACPPPWWAVRPRPWTSSWRAMPLHSPWLQRPNGEWAILGREQSSLGMSCPYVFIRPPGDICEGNLQGGAPGTLQDVLLCVRQMCGQMCHSWMLCELGHICPSSSCNSLELSRTQEEVTPNREIPSLHRRCTVEQNHTQPSVARAPREKQGGSAQRRG